MDDAVDSRWRREGAVASAVSLPLEAGARM